MVLFPVALLWLILVAVWVIRHSQTTPPEEQVWRRFQPRPRAPRDGHAAGGRTRTRKRARAGMR